VDHFRRSTLNYFSAGGLDRATLLRPRDGWLEERLADPATRIVPVWRSRNLLRGGHAPQPVLLSPAELRAAGFDCGAAILLGTHSEVAYFALDLACDEGALSPLIPDNADFRELRDAGPLLDADAGALLAYARAITYWHVRHRHCGRPADSGISRAPIRPSSCWSCTGGAAARSVASSAGSGSGRRPSTPPSPGSSSRGRVSRTPSCGRWRKRRASR
jgi:hypothetical protein